MYNGYQIFRHELRMSLFNGMGEEGKRENLKGRRPKEREGEAEEARGSQENTEEGGKMQTQKREKSLAPPSTASSHGVEHRRPCVRSNVCSIVLIEAFTRPTAEAADPKRFLYFEMVFEALRVFVADA